ncbi:MAG: SdiA-regulated domain-containing protein, partial [Bacteroidota bacterium]|nr:SdiA-regulated domain-containing protein [Bacteroidota bacterium]
VVVNDNIFLTVETDSLCYVVKGTIDGNTMQIHFKPNDTMSLPKPDYTFGNAGFESIAYLPQQHKLIAAYENNAITSAPTAFVFATNLQNKEAVRFTKPLLFRLTDMSSVSGNTLFGLNHYYRDYVDTLTCGVMPKGANTLKNEYCYYVADHLVEAIKEMGANPQQTNFTRIVQLCFRNNKIDWQVKKIISYSSDNWEGILPYKKGVLLVVDGRPPGVPCKLSYFELK